MPDTTWLGIQLRMLQLAHYLFVCFEHNLVIFHIVEFIVPVQSVSHDGEFIGAQLLTPELLQRAGGCCLS